MTLAKFLTVRWNNLFSLGLGLLVVIYGVNALATSAWSEKGGFTGLVVIGVLFWLIVEVHTTMRFAWHKKNTPNYVSAQPGCGLSLMRLAYNAAWLLPIVLAFTGTIDYSTGFIVFSAVSVVRLLANLYLNNALTLAQAEKFPFRAWG